MGEWSDYFEDFPEEDPANSSKRDPDPLEGVMESTRKRVRERSIAERDEVRKKLNEAFSRNDSKKNQS
ncbi:hypothetical protein AB7M29_004407 [Pseudomonas sp. F-14 TE3623]